MLVIVKNRNVHPAGQLFFDVKTFRRLDIFQINAAKSRFQRFDNGDKTVGIRIADNVRVEIEKGSITQVKK